MTPQDEELLRVTDTPSVTETDYAALLSWNLSYQYPHAAAVGLPQKVSASQIAHQAGSDYFERIVAKPGFLSRDRSTAVERGSAHHLFLQYCDFEKARKDIAAEIERLLTEGALSDTQAELIDRAALSKLLQAPLFDRVTASPKIYREERFTVKIRPSLVDETYPDSGDEIVMQGAVDLAFEENGKLVIVDYKTDRVREIGKLAVLYRKQLLLYREALRRSMEQEVGECLICSLSLNDVISVE